MLELAERGGVPCGWILEIVARQPDLLSRAGKVAQEGNKTWCCSYMTPRAGVVGEGVGFFNVLLCGTFERCVRLFRR
jgi:hypothetical protein